MNLKFLLILCLAFLNGSECNRKLNEFLGETSFLQNPFSQAELGRPIPMPQVYKPLATQTKLNKKSFEFTLEKGSFSCDVITLAFDRYHKIIFNPDAYEINQGKPVSRKIKQKKSKSYVKSTRNESLLNKAVINVEQACEDYPTLESDESYTLEVTDSIAIVNSKTSWGMLRALETFSQLVFENEYGELLINETFIQDYPRFNHRGILLDTSRHYIETSILKIHLEAMAANKMNVFHWHIVDDQSFPYQSYTFPELSDKGAFDPYDHIYTSSDVKDIIEFSRQRGIRVVPEFDTPGHTQSWGKSLPILAPCYKDGKPDGTFGPIDPTKNLTYSVLSDLVKELANVFPDKYIHLGGDEVDFSCWKTNPDIIDFMNKNGYGNDFSRLEQYYVQNLLDIVSKVSPSSGYMIWQEVVDNHVKVKSDTVVEVWKDPWPQEMETVTTYGYRTLLSTCWYLNYISYGADWVNYYKCEPLNFNGTDAQKDLVIGGEACMWGEYVDGSNVISRTWPRTTAVAERLWSARDVTDLDDAGDRIEQQRCRMIRRGINAEPFRGPGYCDYEVMA